MTNARLIHVGDLVLHAETPVAPSPRAPILFLHGIFAAAWVFADAQRQLAARGWATYALDLRGHGMSAAVADIGRVPVSAYADDARQAALAVTQVHGRAPIIVGHSMGGVLAQTVAEAGQADALVLLCTAPPRGIPVLGWTLLSRMVKPRYLLPLVRSRPFAPTREDADALIFNRVAPEARAALFARLQPDSGRAGLELALGGPRVEAARVRCPVLSVVADDDRFVAPRAGRATARRYGATLLELPGHAHFLLGEPGAHGVVAEIDRWLDARAGA